MEKEKSYVIRDKVFIMDDVILLGEYIEEEFKAIGSGYKRFEISLECKGNQKYKFKEGELPYFQEKLSRYKSLDTDFLMSGKEKRIKVYLSEGNKSSSYNNQIVVSGEDEDRVNSSFTKIVDIINSVDNQKCLWFKDNAVIGFFVNVFIWIGLLILILYKYIFVNEFDISSLIFILFSLLVFGFALGGGFFSWMHAIIEKNRPNVEFDFGPENGKRIKKRRGNILGALSLFVLPIVIGLILIFMGNLF